MPPQPAVVESPVRPVNPPPQIRQQNGGVVTHSPVNRVNALINTHAQPNIPPEVQVIRSSRVLPDHVVAPPELGHIPI